MRDQLGGETWRFREARSGMVVAVSVDPSLGAGIAMSLSRRCRARSCSLKSRSTYSSAHVWMRERVLWSRGSSWLEEDVCVETEERETRSGEG